MTSNQTTSTRRLTATPVHRSYHQTSTYSTPPDLLVSTTTTPPSYSRSLIPNTNLTAMTTRGTFNVMQLLDAYTNVVESFGTRTDGSNSGGNFLIYGPDYDTNLPLPDGIIRQVGVETN